MDTVIRHINAPAAGDLLIIKDTATERGHTLASWPGPAQLWYCTFDQAFEKAKQWSAASGVTIWRSKDNEIFTRVVVTEVQRAV